jgi:uncharacterized protein with FMN-binding domain
VRRVIAAFVATVAGLVLLLSFKIGPSKSAAQPLASSSLPGSSTPESSGPASATPESSTAPIPASSAATPKATATSTPKAKVSPQPTAKAATKTVTGSSITVGERGQVFGTVQVRLTVTGGKITAVTEVQYPQNDPRSSQISEFAIPTLRAETLKAQGAGIDVVSGATYTSEAYAKSVQAALDAAKA